MFSLVTQEPEAWQSALSSPSSCSEKPSEGRFEVDFAVIHSTRISVSWFLVLWCVRKTLTKRVLRYVSENGVTETLSLMDAVTVTRVGS